MLKKMRNPVAALLLVFSLATPALADVAQPVAQRDGVAEYRLDNGLRIVLAPDASQGAVFFNLVYLAGSLADPEGKGGTAHLLEHLMFKGIGQRTGEQLVGGLRQRGIGFNATTSFDRTRYSATLDADPAKLDWLLELEAERMAGIRFDQAALEGEIGVVLREMELAQDNPLGALGHRLFAAATPGKGLGRHVLGSREELGRVGLADLRQFHETHYRPDNAVIVITGGFDVHQVLDSVARHFGPLRAPASIADATAPTQPVSGQPATVQLRQGNVDVLALAYPLPPASDPRNVALAALADIFAGEPHGRLYQGLVVPGKAQGVFALQQGFGQGGYYLFGALLPAQAQAMDEAQATLIGQLESVGRHRIAAAELQRAQAGSYYMKARLLREPGALAELLSESTALGDWQLLLRRFDQFASLDVETVQWVAEQHFLPQRRLVGQLRAGSEAAVVRPRTDATASALAALSDTLSNTLGVTPPAPIDLAVFNQAIMKVESGIQRGQLGTGLKFALRPTPGATTPVRGILVLRAGDVQSLFGQRALADLTGTVLIRGTQRRSFQQIVDRTKQLGAGLSIVPLGGSLTARFESPAENLGAVLDLLAEVLRQPAFEQVEFDLIKRQQQQAYQRPADQPASVAASRLRRHVQRYPVGDIRRHMEPAELGAALALLGRDDVLRFHQTFYGASQGEVAVSGPFDATQVQKQLEALFGEWNSRTPYARASEPHEDVAPVRLHAKANASQTGYYIGRLHFAANAKSGDTPALFIAEHILGRHPVASRLGRRLREAEGLTYGVRSSIKLATFDDASWVSMQGSYPLGQGHRLADIVKEEVAKLARDGITAQELEQAKRTILHERQLAVGQENNILSWLPGQLFEGRTMQSWVDRNNAFAAVTVEHVNAIVRQYFDADKMVEVLADAEGGK